MNYPTLISLIAGFIGILCPIVSFAYFFGNLKSNFVTHNEHNNNIKMLENKISILDKDLDDYMSQKINEILNAR